MTLEDITDFYRNAKPINYNTKFIDEQLETLNSMHDAGLSSAQGMVSCLSIISSALKYYINTSINGYSDNIMSIVHKLEQIYNINDLIDSLVEIDDVV